MNEEEYFEQLCSNSVDGTLTDSEKQKLEEHLAECPSCAALKEDLEQMHSMLAVDETEPPAGLHDSIMERLRQEETVRGRAAKADAPSAGVYDGSRCGGCRAGCARRRTDARVQYGRQRQYGGSGFRFGGRRRLHGGRRYAG
ncbi:MAG: anti-sigma factor family protein [Butyricicoccus sp.]